MFVSQLIQKSMEPSKLKTQSDILKATEAAVEFGLVSLFSDTYAKCFHLDWAGLNGKQMLINMYLVASSVLNVTDKSVVACEEVIDKGLSRDILDYLNDDKVGPDILSTKGIQTCVLPLISILHNVAQVSSNVNIEYVINTFIYAVHV